MPDDIAEEIAARRREQNDQQQATPLSVTPPPTVANGGVDPVADSIASRRKVALASSITAGMPANPDTRARSMALADQLRLPVDVVERNLPAVEEKARRSKYDLDAIRKNHPELAEWLTNPNNAAVSNDDLPAMRAIDVATRALRGEDPAGVLPPGFLFSGGAIVEPLGDGSLANEYKTVQDLQKELIRRGERHDWAEWERQQQAEDLQKRWGVLSVPGGSAEAATISTMRALNFAGQDRANYLRNAAEESQRASVTLDPSIWGDFQRGVGGVAADLPLMFAGGPIVKGLQSLTRLGQAQTTVRALSKATAKGQGAQGGALLSGERAAASSALGKAEAGALLTGRAADMAKTALTVQPLAIREGVNAAEDNGVANGAMSWLIESAIPGAFGRTGIERAIVPGATDVAAKGWRGVVGQALTDAGYEATEEMVTEWAHAVHEVAAGINPEALDPDQLGRRLLVAGAVGGTVGGATQIPIAIARKLQGDQEESRRATVHADRLTNLAKSVAASKTNDRAAPVVKEAIEKSLGQSDRFQYVDASDFREAYADPAAAAASMGLADEYAKALAAGTPLQIPTATFVQMAAKDEATAKLIGKARRSPDAWHAEQAAEFTEKAPDEVRRLQNEAKASAANVATTPADAVAKVEQDIEAKLIKAGHDPVRAKTNAKLMANTFATFAKRSGKDAGELFQQYLDGNIKKVLPQLLKGEKFDLVDSMIDRIRTGEVPSDKEINGPSLVDFLRPKGLAVDGTLSAEIKQLLESDRSRLPGERALIRPAMKMQEDGTFVRDAWDLDFARQLAADKGYIPQDATLNDFMTALDNEIRGNSPSYVEGNGDPNKRAVRESLDRMAEALSAAGVDPLTATNKQAREALAKMMEEQDSKGYEQTDPTAAPMDDTIEVDGKQRPTLNSDGKRIAKDEESVRNFWRWFGDSKVVDADGRPLVVYHGSPKAFDVFDSKRIGEAHGRSEGAGFYFTTSQETAAGYTEGGEPMAVYLKIGKPIAYNAPGFKEAQLKKALLAAAKIEAEREGSDQRDGFLSNFGDTYTGGVQSAASEAARLISADETAVDQLGGIVGSGVSPEIVNEAVRKTLGFDGYVSNGFSNSGGEGGVIWVATTPTQIKSATGNVGTFDGSNPRIYNQGGAVVDAPRSGRLDLDALLKQWRKATGDRTPIGGDAAFQALAEEADAVDAANGKQYNQPAYHGTGNSQPYDTLRYDKVNGEGGEGTQNEGWGVYVTKEKQAARFYREQNRNLLGSGPSMQDMLRVYFKPGREVPSYGGKQRVVSFNERADGLWSVTTVPGDNYAAFDRAQSDGERRRLMSTHSTPPDQKALDKVLAEEAPELVQKMKENEGRLYTVDIPDNTGDNYLDWDKSIKDQSKELRARLSKAGVEDFHQVADGEHIYNSIVRRLGSKKAASDALHAVGVVGIKYKGDDDSGHNNYVIFQDVPVREYQQPKGKGTGPRGSLVFGKAGTPFTIKLFQSENLSTFAHESAHLSLEILSDLATADGAAPDLVADFRKVRDWFKANADDIRKQARDLAKDRGAPAHVITNGIENLSDEQIAAIAEDFVSPPADGTAGSYVHEAMHEYFARGWEGYLLEGKAPTAALRSVFARVKGWMTAIYKIVATLRVNLSPEIRGVFDRLVAIEDETDAAEDRAGTKDILPPEAFPDLQTFDAYRTAVQASHDAAEASLQRQLISDYTKEWKKAQTEQREEIREEVADEVNAQPVYQAIAALQRAQLPEGGQVDAYVGLKLDREELVREWGEVVLSKLPGPGSRANSGAYVYANENGMSIATVAQMFGYSDPSAMIEAMVAAPDRVSLIETQTEKRMRAEHPDPLLDGSLPDRATAAIHGEERAELLARELRALGMKTGQTPAPVAVLREFARSTIEKQLARDLRPAIYKAAAATANRRAIEAAAKQDWGTAYVEKQREALNLEMYRASRDAVEAGEKSRDYLRSLNTLAARQRIGKAGGWEFTVFDREGAEVATYPTVDEARAAVLPGQSFRQTNGYLEQIDAIQDGYSLRRTSNRKLRKGERMRKWMAEQQKDDPEFEIDGRIMSDLDVGNVNWNDLTVQDQATVVDAVRAIENQAKLKNKLLKAKEVRDLAAAQEMGARSILENKKGNAPKSQQGDTVLESGARSGKGFLGWHRKDSFLIRQMDGYEDAGAMWELIQRPRNDAATDEEARNLVNAAAVEAIFKKWGKGLGWTRQEIAGTKLRLTLEHRIAMALNWGHAEGRRRILRQLEADGMDQRDVQAVLDSLDDADFAMIDELVALINSHWSEVAALEQRQNGIPPEKVKALPWSTRDPVTGKTTWHQGGYYPLKYDAEKSKRAGDAAAAAAFKENASAAGAKGYTRRSHTKQRAEDVKGLVVDLSIDVAGKHLAEVVHDLTHREMVRDQLRLLKEGTPIAEAIIQKHGIAKWKQLVETTGAIATRDVQPDSKVARFVRMVRRGNTAAVFTYSLSSALMNLTGVLSSVARVGPLRLLSALGSVTANATTMEWAGTWVQEKSAMMKVRGGNNVREVSEALREVGHTNGLQKAIRIGYLPMQKVVQLVDTITWIAAYRQHMDAALAQGKTESEADEQAIAVADQTVIDTQGSGRIGDMSAIQRGGEFAKLFTMFYGYFNVQANLIGEQYGKAREEGGAQWINSALVVLMLGPVATILTNLIKAGLRGDERKEDAKEMALRMLAEQGGTAAGMLVGVREVSSAIESGFGYSGPASLSAIGNATKLIQDIKQGDLDGIAKGAISTVGSLTGAPSRVANQVLDAFLQFEEDGKGGRALRTMLFGKPLKDHK